MGRVSNMDGNGEVNNESTGLIDKVISLIDNPSDEGLSQVAAELEAFSEATKIVADASEVNFEFTDSDR